MICKIRGMLQDVLEKHDALLLPGEVTVLAALHDLLLTHGENIPLDTLEGIRAGVRLVGLMVERAGAYIDLHTDLDCIDSAFQARIAGQQPVTIVVRITLLGKYNGDTSCANLANLLWGIDGGRVKGDVEASIEERKAQHSRANPSPRYYPPF